MSMLYDFIIIDKDKNTPLYRQIYLSVRNSIENGSLKKGTKMPSIRRLSDDLEVSKTTITGAYDQLCAEGYIISKAQRGYFVEAQFENVPKYNEQETAQNKSPEKYYKYDFSGKSIDEKIININEWKKYVKEVLNQSYLLTSYGEAQGEQVLRNALQKYGLGTRSVNTSAENIVVGAGTQTLLFTLCSLIGRDKTVATENSSYVQSEYIFKSFGYKIKYFNSDDFGVTVESLNKIKPDIVLINPNFSGKSGKNMPVTRRLEVINWARQNNALIIEDDYNGELRYSTHPTPCVQNYDNENTVYIGSFSKVLLPSVRLSYMALPQKYLAEYKKIKAYTNQTASKAEQLALAKYIGNCKIDAHIRKARRIYLEKSKVMIESIERHFGKNIKFIFNETSLYLSVFTEKNIDIDKVINNLEENSVCIMKNKSDNKTITISFSGISDNLIDKGIEIISNSIK